MHAHPEHFSKPKSKILALILIVFSVIIFNFQLPHTTVTQITNNQQNIQIQTDSNQEILIDNTDPILEHIQVGTRIETQDLGDNQFAIADIYRLTGVKIILGFFALFCLAVTNLQAIGSLVSIILSILVIFNFTLPLILNGHNPLLICLASCVALVPISFYLSHGFNKKAHLSAISSIITLAIAAIFTTIFTKVSVLTGLSSEEARFLMIGPYANLDFRGILFGGMMISLIGILDDITITQTSVVQKLKKTQKKVFADAMHVGQDHIASLINTIFLIYAGAALPTLLLFATEPQSIAGLLNFEPIAEEIVRSIIGSISLIMAVPISTYFADKNL